jgi:hypothetical protein
MTVSLRSYCVRLASIICLSLTSTPVLAEISSGTEFEKELGKKGYLRSICAYNFCSLALASDGAWAAEWRPGFGGNPDSVVFNCREVSSAPGSCRVVDVNGESEFIKGEGTGCLGLECTQSNQASNNQSGTSDTLGGNNTTSRPAGRFFEVPIDFAHKEVVKALSANGLSIVSDDFNTHRIRAKMSGYMTGIFACFGHKITVRLIPFDGGTSIDIVEKLILPTQVIGCKKVTPRLSTYLSASLSKPQSIGQKTQVVSSDNSIEIEYWRSIKDSIDPGEYQNYLDDFPGGRFAKLAESRIKKLRGKGVNNPDQSADGSDNDLAFWQSIKDSNDPDMYREYLRQFPSGVYAGLAKLKIRKLGGDTQVVNASIPNLDYGDYYALVIGNNEYPGLSNLRSAVGDARAVSNVLEVDYGFKVDHLENATRSQILRSIGKLRANVTSKDNVLIYYAGHGYLDQAADEGYWLPIDADRSDQSNWIATDRIVSQVKAMKAKHVMVVVDSCFSGTITRAIKIEQRTPEWLSEIVKKKARTALTSGGLEPVMDTGSGNHSAFAYAFISLLEENDGVLDASQLFSKLRPKVMVNSTQTPQYGKIHMAGDDGGDFLFVRQ